MELIYLRMLAHLLLLGWATAVAILLFLARGKTVQLLYVGWGITGLCLFAAWLIGLLLSMRQTGFIARETLVPVLMMFELGAGLLAWFWLVPSVRHSFRICRRGLEC